MAEKEEDLDLDVKPARNSKKMIIVFAVLGVLLIGASVATTLLLLGGEKSAEDEAEKPAAVPQAHYLPLENMVVNFAQRGPARFLQVEMQLMAHNPAVLKSVEQHMPVIRNDLLMLLGSISYEEASSSEGKQRLNQAILDAVNAILSQHGVKDTVKAVYFTSFVMQ